MFFSHRFSFKMDFMGIVDKTIKDGISDSGIADDVVPVIYGQLTGDDGRSMPVLSSIISARISSFCITHGSNAQVVNNQDIGFGEFIHDFSVTAVTFGDSHFIIEFWTAGM